MLQTLYIENIAVIEKATIDFNNGLNVLTGETGAGKSIIIDALNAILGHRTSKEIIRTGEKSAFVSASFDNIGEEARRWLMDAQLYDEDGELVIQRSLSQSGKSACKINGRPVTAAMLRELSEHLINIHGQHESYELFSPDTHIRYIDNYGRLGGLLEEYSAKYQKYKILKKKINEADTDEAQRLREIDILSFQSSELIDADVTEGEEEQLETERRTLANFEKISGLLMKAKLFLSGDDSNGAAESVDMAASAVNSAAAYNEEYSELGSTLTDIYYSLRDCADSLEDAIDGLEGDPERLEEIEERLDLLNRLSRKYGCSADELPALAEKMQARLNELLNFDRDREQIERDFKDAEAQAWDCAEKLREKRKAAALDFAEKVKAEMSFLNMPGVELVPRFEECQLGDDGADRMELLISANPGEAPRPVAKIASGGELSRMMLAIKIVLADSDRVDTLIFDEVDTGISGSAAEKVGLKLKQAARGCQVLCVTHQAQIAGLADYHYLISKQTDGGRTYTRVTLLDREGRKNELARIIGGITITEAALKHAESMLDKSVE